MFDFLRYLPLFLENQSRDTLETILHAAATAAKEVQIKAFEAIHNRGPVEVSRDKHTFRTELFKKIEFTSYPVLALSGASFASGYAKGEVLFYPQIYTLETWFEPVASGISADNLYLIAGSDVTGYEQFGIYQSGSYVLCRARSGSNISTLAYDLGSQVFKLHQAVMSVSGSYADFYVDGRKVASGPMYFNNIVAYFDIGGTDYGRYFSGNIYKTSFYYRPLEEKEIYEHYLAIYAENVPLSRDLKLYEWGYVSGNILYGRNANLTLAGNYGAATYQYSGTYLTAPGRYYEVPELTDGFEQGKYYKVNEFYTISHAYTLYTSGVSGTLSGTYFAPVADVINYNFYNSWGKFLGLKEEWDTEHYQHRIRGIISLLYSPPTIDNVKRLTAVAGDVPFAYYSGVIVEVRPSSIVVNYENGTTYVYRYPPTAIPLPSGTQVRPFDPLIEGIRVLDYVVDSDWTRYIYKGNVEEFLEANIPDEIIRKELKYTLYLISVESFLIQFYPDLEDAYYIRSFFDRINPVGTRYVYAFTDLIESYIYSPFISGVQSGIISGMGFSPSEDIDLTPNLRYNINMLTGQKNVVSGYPDLLNECTIPRLKCGYEISGSLGVSGTIKQFGFSSGLEITSYVDMGDIWS